MIVLATVVALCQYAAVLTAVAGLSRLSVLLAMRAVELWQASLVEPEHTGS